MTKSSNERNDVKLS